MTLRMNSPNQDLAIRFAISSTSVSRIFTTWLMPLYQKQKKFCSIAVLAIQRVNHKHNAAVVHRPIPVNPSDHRLHSFRSRCRLTQTCNESRGPATRIETPFKRLWGSRQVAPSRSCRRFTVAHCLTGRLLPPARSWSWMPVTPSWPTKAL